LTESCACGTIMDSNEISTGAAGPPLQGVMSQLINWDEGNYTVNDQPNPRGMYICYFSQETVLNHLYPHN
jgi:hypothetical protein